MIGIMPGGCIITPDPIKIIEKIIEGETSKKPKIEKIIEEETS
jgi:hypothetical protein